MDIEFNLKDALAGCPLVTRSGKRTVVHFEIDEDEPKESKLLVILFNNSNDDSEVMRYYPNGRFYEQAEDEDDILMDYDNWNLEAATKAYKMECWNEDESKAEVLDVITDLGKLPIYKGDQPILGINKQGQLVQMKRCKPIIEKMTIEQVCKELGRNVVIV